MKVHTIALLTLITLSQTVLFFHNTLPMEPLTHFKPPECCICLEDVVGIDGISIVCPNVIHRNQKKNKGIFWDYETGSFIEKRREGMCGPCFKQCNETTCPICRTALVDYKTFYPNLPVHIDREIKSLPEGYKGRLACSCCKKSYDEHTLSSRPAAVFSSNPITHLGCEGYNHFSCIACLEGIPIYNNQRRCPDCFQVIKFEKISLSPASALTFVLHAQASQTLALKIMAKLAKEKTCRICNKENDLSDFVWFGCGHNKHKICVYCMRTYLMMTKYIDCVLCLEDCKGEYSKNTRVRRDCVDLREQNINDSIDTIVYVKRQILKIKRKNGEGSPPSFTAQIVFDDYLNRLKIARQVKEANTSCILQ